MTEILLNREFENFYCPVTGEPVLHSEGYHTPPTLLFIYVEELWDFEYCSESLKKKFPLHFDEKGQTINGQFLYKTMKRHLQWGQDKLLITYRAMGSATLCFDLGYERK